MCSNRRDHACSCCCCRAPRSGDVRFATFNASLNRPAAGLLATQLANPDVDDQYRRQAKNVAEVIQRVRADVLLVNEFDPLQNGDVGVSPGPENLFRDNFLEVSQNGAAPIEFPYVFIAPSNTGVATGKDLNNNGVAVTTPGAPGYGDDAFGFGAFPGQFGMVVYSKYPIELDEVRTFQPVQVEGHAGRTLDPDARSTRPTSSTILRLSSKSHWDVPIDDRRQDRPLPRLPPDPAGLRRAGGSQRPPQLRRDPLLGRLHHARASRATSTTTTGCTGA